MPLRHAAAGENSQRVFYSSHPSSVSIHLLPKNELEETAHLPLQPLCRPLFKKKMAFARSENREYTYIVFHATWTYVLF